MQLFIPAKTLVKHVRQSEGTTKNGQSRETGDTRRRQQQHALDTTIRKQTQIT